MFEYVKGWDISFLNLINYAFILRRQWLHSTALHLLYTYQLQ